MFIVSLGWRVGFGGSFLGYGGANESSLGRVAYNHYNAVLLQVHFIY